jgi:hypothetical protein
LMGTVTRICCCAEPIIADGAFSTLRIAETWGRTPPQPCRDSTTRFRTSGLISNSALVDWAAALGYCPVVAFRDKYHQQGLLPPESGHTGYLRGFRGAKCPLCGKKQAFGPFFCCVRFRPGGLPTVLMTPPRFKMRPPQRPRD